MVKAELEDGDSTIKISLDSDGQAYVAVRFNDSAANPTGKLVRVPQIGSTPSIKGWMNRAAENGYRPLPWITPSAERVDQEYTGFSTSSGDASFRINVLKADDLNVDITEYVPHRADMAGTLLLDTKHADNSRLYNLQVRQWKFSNGEHNQVIITIVMIDDQGGGNA